MRTQLSMEIEEGRAAALMGLPESANPYRRHFTGRLHECAANWASGWNSVQQGQKETKPATSTGTLEVAAGMPRYQRRVSGNAAKLACSTSPQAAAERYYKCPRCGYFAFDGKECMDCGFRP